MKSSRLFIFFAIYLLTSMLFSQETGATYDTGSATQDTKQSDQEKKQQELEQNLSDARKALKFGIDQTVIGVIKQASANKDGRLSAEIAAKLDSLNPEVQKAALEFFVTIKDFSGIDRIIQLLGNYNDLDSSVSTAIMLYLREANQKADIVLQKLLIELTDNAKQEVQIGAIDTLGKIGGEAQIDALLKLFKKSGVTTPVRAAILRSFSSINNDSAKSLLKDIASNSAEDKALRYEAVSAIGNTGDQSALSIIAKSIRSADIFERGAAIGALAGYPEEKVVSLYDQALRDSYWRNRSNVISTIGKRKILSFEEAIAYIAESDPELPVKVEAYKTLSILDTLAAWDSLKLFFEDEKNGGQFRQLSADLIISKHFLPFKESIRTVMQKEWTKEGVNAKLLEIICLGLSQLHDGVAADLYEKMLTHPSQTIKIYGIRGIQTNTLIGMYPQLQAMLSTSQTPAVKAAIQEVLNPTPKK